LHRLLEAVLDDPTRNNREALLAELGVMAGNVSRETSTS
jgi:hypothetical protein